jgi:hypothetical protein
MEREEENNELAPDQLIKYIKQLEAENKRLLMNLQFLQEIIQEKNHELGLG